jgi:pimeloyl-ACP methyl ester carboxylesterase
MASWIEGDVTANGIRLHYARTGGAKPPLVLAHGFSDDGPCWTPVAEILASDYDAIMVDARCHGRSEAPDAPFGTSDQAADLAGFIAALGLEKPIVLGHSMGAATALALAGAYPDLPKAILLEDPPARWMPGAASPSRNDEWRERMRAWLTELKSKSREQIIADQRVAAPGWSETELETWADSKLRLHPNVFQRNAASEFDGEERARRITCPALLITADPDRGAIVTEEQAAALQALVPQLRIARIPGAGHSIRREQFEPYMEAARGFLSRL